MTDHDRGAYTPQTDAPLSFDARRAHGGGRPVPMTLLISGMVLVILLIGVVYFYRSGVRPAGQAPQVVGAPVLSTKAPAPAQDFAPAITGKQALASVQGMPGWKKMNSWGQPELVVWQGNGEWITPVLTWKFVGESLIVDDKLHKTFFVNASTGAIEYVREDVHYEDVNGSVKGMGSAGVLPDAASNPPSLLSLSDIRAQIAGGNNAYTNSGGLFSITNAGTDNLNVSSPFSTTDSQFGSQQWLKYRAALPPAPPSITVRSSTVKRNVWLSSAALSS